MKPPARIRVTWGFRSYPGDQRKVWSWHAYSRNGRKIGWSGETYTSRAHCLRAMEAVTAATARGIAVDVEPTR